MKAPFLLPPTRMVPEVLVEVGEVTHLLAGAFTDLLRRIELSRWGGRRPARTSVTPMAKTAINAHNHPVETVTALVPQFVGDSEFVVAALGGAV